MSEVCYTVENIVGNFPILTRAFMSSPSEAMSCALGYVATYRNNKNSKEEGKIVIKVRNKEYNISEAYNDIIKNGYISFNGGYLFLKNAISGSSQNRFFLGKGYGRKDVVFDLVWTENPVPEQQGKILSYPKPNEVLFYNDGKFTSFTAH